MTSDDDPTLEETEPMSDRKRNAIISAAATIIVALGYGAFSYLVGAL